MNNIPVILVVYKRARHTYKVLESLRRHNVQNLYIFSDGTKGQQDLQQVQEVRQLLRQIDWCEPVIIEQPQNIGLAKSIVGATDYVFQKYDKLILLEDDCVPEEHFFDFMTTCLQKYENSPKVFGISGFTVAIPEEIVRSYPYDLYFCPRIGSHGWGTWKRAWQHHGRNLRELIDEAISKGIDLDQGGSDIPIFISDLLQGKLKDVWTLNWVLSVYLNNGVYIYPTGSHITNIGMDGSGVHCGATNRYDTPVCRRKPANYPQEVFLDGNIMKFWRKFYDTSPARRAQVILPRPVLGKSEASLAGVTVGYVSSNDIKGGAQRVGWVLKEGLKARGYRTRMFVGHKFSNDPDVKVIKDAICDDSDYYKKQGYLYYDISSTFLLNHQKEFVECDIIHFHNLHGDYFNPFALSSLTKNKPSVWTLHDIQSLTGHCARLLDCMKWQTGCGNCPNPDTYPAISKDRTAEMWQHKKRIYEKSDFELIVPSQWLKNIVEKSILKEKKVHLIYNGIDPNIYKPHNKAACRRKFKIPDDAVVIEFSANGGLRDVTKGTEFILSAYQHLIAKYPNVYFICIGGRAENAPTERLLQVPFVFDEKLLAELYCAADVFVYPTLADNCPLVVLELMGCGVPVVSFNIGGVPELIEHGKTGFVAGYKNCTELIQMTEHLIVNKAKREEFSRAGLERFNKMFTLDQMIDKHVQLYERLAEKGEKKNYTSPGNKVSLSPIADRKKYDYLVSAIVSTYNSERHIRTCLEDLESQTIADKLEIIVVNSGSQQNEEAIVKEFQQKYDNVKYIRTEKRETIYKAWNRAIKASSGKYITNANTDDRHTKDAFERMAKALDENPDKVLVYANQVDVNEIDGQRVAVGERINGQFSRQRLFDGQCPPGSQPMWRRDVHNLLGYFDECFVVGGDSEFWFRLTQKFDFFYLDETLGERFISDEVVSRSNSDLALWENMIIRKSYECAHQRMITVGAEGISENPLFSTWPEVNIWKRMVKAKLTGAQPSQPADNIKDCWDCRTNPKPRLTIVVVTFNRPRELLENLNSLNEQTDKNFEVIVVDNGGNLSELKNRAGEFNYGILGVELKCNFGPSPARNIGVGFAKAEYISFLDDDAVADRNLVSNVIRHFEEHDIAGMRGKILPKSKKSIENIPVPVDYDLGDEIIISACDGGTFSVFRRDIFLKACGFDEFLFGSEGIELSYRISKIHDKKVRSILYFPDVIVYHDYYRSEPACTEKTLRWEWMQRLARKKEAEIIGYSEYIHSLYPTEKESVENDYSRILNIAVYLMRDFCEEALKYAEKAVALEPDMIKGRYLLGVLYVELGRYGEAVDTLEPVFSTLLMQLQEFSSLSESDPEFENRAVMAECCLGAGTKLAQCYMKKGLYNKLKRVYTLLLDSPHLTILQEQRDSIREILVKLYNVKDVPVQAEASRVNSPVPRSLSPKPCLNAADKAEEKYLVSAIVSTYNAERFIRGCLEDLENQTMADRLEIIVVNSGSQQNEEAIVKEFQRRYSNVVYIKTEQREGIYTAWNRAVKVAHGRYLTVANTDDRHRKDALEILSAALESNPDVALVYADQIVTRKENETFYDNSSSEHYRYPDYTPEVFLDIGWCKIGSQPMWRVSLHKEVGLFDENFQVAGDYDFLLRVCERYDCLHVPQLLGTFYRSDSTVSCGKHERLNKIENPVARARSFFRKGVEAINEGSFEKAIYCLEQSMHIWPSREAVEQLSIAASKVNHYKWRNTDQQTRQLPSIYDWPDQTPIDRAAIHARSSTVPQVKKDDGILVSAIVSTYNSERFLRGCLKDLENQTIVDRLEIIVVNSGSQQNEEAIVKEFQQRYDNIKYIRTEQRETIYAAWNKGIRLASGKYITSANTDDRHTRDALEKMANALEQNPDRVLVYGNQERVTQDNGRLTSLGVFIRGEFKRSRLFADHCPPDSQPMWRRDVHDIFGYFDEGFFVSGDYEFWFRITQKFDFLYLNEVIGQKFIDDKAVSRANRDLIEWENYIILRECYRYALHENITVDGKGISENPLFARWPEVNIWKEKVRRKLTGVTPRYLSDDIKQLWDYRANQKPDLSIIVATCNQPAQLLENLGALNNQTNKNFELIVVNNGQPIPQLQQPTSQYRYPLCYVELNNNFGHSPAKNTGAGYALAPYIAFLDEDAVPEENFVKNILHNFSVGAMAGLRGKILPLGNQSACLIPPRIDLVDSPTPVACDVSSNMAFKRDIFLQAGMFDPVLFGCEGAELSFRIFKLLGEKLDSILYCPDVVVFRDTPKGAAYVEKNIRFEAMIQLVRRRYKDAIPYLEYMQNLYPRNKSKAETDFLWALDNCMFLEKNNPVEAMKWAQKAFLIEPDGIKIRYVLGFLYARLGIYDKAEEVLESILPVLTQPRIMDESLMSGKEFETRVVSFSECYIGTCTLLAECYLHKKRYDKVREVYTRLLNNPTVKIDDSQKTAIVSVLQKLTSTGVATAIDRQESKKHSKPAGYDNYIVGQKYGNPCISVIPQYECSGNPLVSVIMPAFNAADYIAEAIESVLIQNYRNFELVIVDDGSTDRTRDIIAGFRDPKIRYFYQANSGASCARNFALKQAGGQYIVLLDADDMITPDFIAQHLQELERHTNTDLVYSDYCLIDENSKPIRVLKRPEYADEKLLIRDLFRCGFPVVQFNHTCLRKSVFDKIGFYDEKLIVAEDYDMIRRFLKCGLKVHHVGQVLYLRRMTNESLSRSFTAEKAKCHFEVVRRFAETFSPEELFPDIQWDKIPPEVRQLHAKCKAAATCLAIGQTYVRENMPDYAKRAFELACSQVSSCLEIAPENQQVRQMLARCESVKNEFSQMV